MLRLLEEKGHIHHQQVGKKYVFMPKTAKKRASRSALRGLVRTFFDGSVENAVASLLEMNQEDLSQDELDRLGKLIEQAKKEGR